MARLTDSLLGFKASPRPRASIPEKKGVKLADVDRLKGLNPNLAGSERPRDFASVPGRGRVRDLLRSLPEINLSDLQKHNFEMKKNLGRGATSQVLLYKSPNASDSPFATPSRTPSRRRSTGKPEHLQERSWDADVVSGPAAFGQQDSSLRGIRARMAEMAVHEEDSDGELDDEDDDEPEETEIAIKFVRSREVQDDIGGVEDLPIEEQDFTDYENEVQILESMEPHPNVVELLGKGEHQENGLAVKFIAMQPLLGGSLEDVVKKQREALNKGKAPIYQWGNVIQWAINLASGMAHVHHSGVVHRDLKLGNLMLDSEWSLKVLDFGLARRIPQMNPGARYVMTGGCGSYKYMAPEVYKRQAYNEKVDVFAFAVILYELLAARSFDEVLVDQQAEARRGAAGRLSMALNPHLVPADSSSAQSTDAPSPKESAMDVDEESEAGAGASGGVSGGGVAAMIAARQKGVGAGAAGAPGEGGAKGPGEGPAARSAMLPVQIRLPSSVLHPTVVAGTHQSHRACVKAACFGWRADVDPSWPEPIQRLIRRCWSPRPGDRPSFREAIDHLSTQAPLPTTPPPAPELEKGKAPPVHPRTKHKSGPNARNLGEKDPGKSGAGKKHPPGSGAAAAAAAAGMSGAARAAAASPRVSQLSGAGGGGFGGGGAAGGKPPPGSAASHNSKPGPSTSIADSSPWDSMSTTEASMAGGDDQPARASGGSDAPAPKSAGGSHASSLAGAPPAYVEQAAVMAAAKSASSSHATVSGVGGGGGGGGKKDKEKKSTGCNCAIM